MEKRYQFRPITESERKLFITALDWLADKLEDEESLDLAQNLSLELGRLNKEEFLERILLQLKDEVQRMIPKKQKALYYYSIAVLEEADTFEDAWRGILEKSQRVALTDMERAFFQMLLQRMGGMS